MMAAGEYLINYFFNASKILSSHIDTIMPVV